MAERFEMVDVDFGPDVEGEIEEYLNQSITNLVMSHKELHESKLPRWRRLYLGIPAEPTKSFPWPNASNVVVQVIGEAVDTLAARVLGLLYATHPLWIFQNYQKYDTPREAKEAETRRKCLEDFMDLMGIEPDQVNLYETEGLWFTDAARLGTSFAKLSIEDVAERMVVGYSEQKISGKEFKRRDYGVTKLRHEHVLADARFQTLDKAPLVVQIVPLLRTQLEERAFKGFYDKKAVRAILDSPDRSTMRTPERQELQDQGIQPSAGGGSDYLAEWDIYECYLPWYFKGKKYRLIISYHKASRTILRKVFNFMPKNKLPILRAKLGYRTDELYGHGYGELLEYYQEELSSVHNRRNDNATIANIRAFRVSPRARNLDANFELYPGALIVGEKDDFEAIQVGDVYPSSFKEEQLTLDLTARRSGISPAQSGFGTGGMMKRPVMYSAGATLAVMQENNSRVGHATSEFRHAHAMLGIALTEMYGKFGIGNRAEIFGKNGPQIEAALKEFEANVLRIPLRASTGSLNSEIAKQNDMIMIGLVQRFYTAIGQLMQAINNPMIPPSVGEYFTNVVQSHTLLMKQVMKDFGYDQPDQYIPDPKIEQPPAGAPQAGGPGGQAQGGGGGAPVPGAFGAAGGGGGPMVPGGPGGGVSGGPPGSPEPGAR